MRAAEPPGTFPPLPYEPPLVEFSKVVEPLVPKPVLYPAETDASDGFSPPSLFKGITNTALLTNCC